MVRAISLAILLHKYKDKTTTLAEYETIRVV